MAKDEWELSLKLMNNQQLAEECERITEWCDPYYFEFLKVLEDEIVKRLNQQGDIK